jgi:hypothetical protein
LQDVQIPNIAWTATYKVKLNPIYHFSKLLRRFVVIYAPRLPNLWHLYDFLPLRKRNL